VPAEESALFRLRAIEAQGIGADRLTVTAPGTDPGSLTTTGNASAPKRRP
jgi:hypothetical protein